MEGDQTIHPPPHGLSDGAQKIRALHGRTSGPTRRSTKGQWTPEEDEILRKAVQRFKGKNWKKIAECFKDRTDVQCLHRWQKVLNPELIKGPWSKEEDETIIELVNKFGAKKWSNIAQHLPGRIGKQCRERWHNHLNPAINKEAWTRDEELTLIRAHQIYGNKWAELTKFLPGRTDNAIKNHWNSSVKKKLDSYLQSGLLAQFQPLPHVGNPTQAMVSTSSGLQFSGDDNSPKGTEGEEVSECSQESANAGQFPLSGETASIVLHSRDDFRPNEDSDLGKEHSPSHACCSEPYYISLDDISFPDMAPPEVCSSQFIERRFSHESGNSTIQYCQLVVHGLPNNSSLDLRQESSQLQRDYIASDESHGMAIVPFQVPMGLAASTSMDSVQPGQMLISDDECCKVLFTEALNDGCYSSGDYNRAVDIVDLSGCTSFLCQSSSMQISETGGTSVSQTTCPMSSNTLIGASCSQSVPSVPSLLSSEDSRVVYNAHTNHFEAEDLQVLAGANDSLIHAKESSNSPCVNGINHTEMQEPPVIERDTLKLITVNTSCGSASKQVCPMSSNNLIGASWSHSISSVPSLLSSNDSRVVSNAQINQLGAEDLQLVEANGSLIDAKESSNSPYVEGINSTEMPEPLVIERDTSKLVTVNASCGLDSKQACQSMDEKPNVHKEQEDTGVLCYEPPRFPSLDVPFFSCDLVQSGGEMQQEFSPLGIRQLMMSPVNCLTPFRLWDSPSRDSPESLLKSAAKTFMGTPSILKKRHRDLLTPLSDKRIDKKLEIEMTSTLTRGFSRLEFMFDDNDSREVDLVSPASMQKWEASEGKQNGKTESSMLGDGKSKTDIGDSNSLDTVDQRPLLVDSNMKVDIAVTSEIVQPPSEVLVEHNMNDLLLHSPNHVGFKLDKTISSSARTPKSQSIFLKSFSGNPFSSISSPSVLVKENTGDHTGNGAGFEAFNIFGGTPFRRSLESPSAWKSPWFAFLPGPKIDTEITIEDIGIFMSPGDRRYDALGLMKEISDQTAAACANAQEVLRNEIPKGLSKGATGKDLSKENIDPNEPRNHSQLAASSALLERRTLDFSECTTPGKGLKSKPPAMSFSSPSSYLLKGCR